MLVRIKKILRPVVDLSQLIFGLIFYLLMKKTPTKSALSMVRIFCLSRGLSNDFLSKLISLYKRKYRLTEIKGLLSNCNEASIREILTDLNRDGYYVFENCISTEMLSTILDFAHENKCFPRPTDTSLIAKESPILFSERGNLSNVIYDFELSDLVNSKIIQDLMADSSMIAVAQEYLGCKPRLDFVALWWTSESMVADNNAAQTFHFDMDRIKWIKFFVYVTDVTLSNGPHAFIKETHKRGMIPKQILKQGYARISDMEISKYYSEDKICTFAAKAGTVIAEDTRGLHKGIPVFEGNRLLLQFQFSNSFFGMNTVKAKIDKIISPKLAEMCHRYPQIYSYYL